MQFSDYFRQATGRDPYPYQEHFAEMNGFPGCLDVPTGAGKTATVVLGWLWKRRTQSATTSRRLVYCLPMRVLVEQTEQAIRGWLERLGLQRSVRLVTLMGGIRPTSESSAWDIHPEQDAIILGTQDMLLSRALNRGYGMSRYRWPLHYGVLHNDAFWVFDELQLMGPGLRTSAQLEAFRQRFGTFGQSGSMWMSATLQRSWLTTVDFDPDRHGPTLGLSPADRAFPQLRTRLEAAKALSKAKSRAGDTKSIVPEVLQQHQAGTLTLVIVNTVARATELYDELRKSKRAPQCLLIHSRFRPPERRSRLQRLLELQSATPAEGAVIVSTQVIEAGVDLSATVLFTELAPWSSLVQRFGRCNRDGKSREARIFWLDFPEKLKPQPYEQEALAEAQGLLSEISDAAPHLLPPSPEEQKFTPVLRTKDFLELYDTTPDLAGYDIDVSRYIRDANETDAQVFWRDVSEPETDEAPPNPDELCSVPLGELREYLQKSAGFVRDYLQGQWVPVKDQLYPGMLVMLRSNEGGYEVDRGWSKNARTRVSPVQVKLARPESYDADRWSETNVWQTIAEHTDDVVAQVQALTHLVSEPFHQELTTTARWHDLGKAHIPGFQAKIKPDAAGRPADSIAKAPRKAWMKSGERKHFRHELASALVALQMGCSDLVAYLCACHHGKVRLSLRSVPGENAPEDGRRFARGVWDGDSVGPVSLGGGVAVPETTLDLSLMELGEGPAGPSWVARMLALLSQHGPFRMGYLEALIKCADERASQLAQSAERMEESLV